jgi:hypothetical protein
MTDAVSILVGLAVDRTNVHDIGLLQLTSEDDSRHLGFEQRPILPNTFDWTNVTIQRR